MPTVFISHSSKDRGFVENELIPLLKKGGLNPWYSTDEIVTAADWERCIKKGLRECDWFLLVMSPRSQSSDWVRTEVAWAAENRKDRIVPVLLEDCQPEEFHLHLIRVQHVDFRESANRASSRQRLLMVWNPLRDAGARSGGLLAPVVETIRMGEASIERVLARYCQERVAEWDTARHDENDRDKLMHYIEPHYSWLKDATQVTDRSSQVERNAQPRENPRDALYEPVAAAGDDAETELVKLFNGSRLICLAEDAGAGKTIFIRRFEAFLCSEQAQQTLFDGRPWLVVRFEKTARGWPADFGAAFEQALANAVSAACHATQGGVLPQQVVEWVLQNHRLVLLLDALDQVENEATIVALQQFLSTGYGRHCRVVLTSRAFAVNDRQHTLFHVSGWRLGRIEGFDIQQQYAYLQGIPHIGTGELPADVEERRALCRERLEAVFPQYDQVAELLRVPVVLSLVRTLAKDKPLKPFRTRGELYLQVEKDLMQRATAKLGRKPDLRLLRRWREVLAATAFEMMARGVWDYTVHGDAVLNLQDAAGPRCQPPIAEQEWKDLEQVSDCTDRCLLETANREQFGFKHRGMMEFYCGLHLVANRQAGWVLKETDSHGQITSIRCGEPYLAGVTTDDNWHWAWRFAAEMSSDAADLPDGGEVLCASLSELFRLPAAGRRPTELIYRAWRRFEIDPLVLREQDWTDTPGCALHEATLVARGRKLLLPGAAAVLRELRRPLAGLSAELEQGDCFARCPPAELEQAERKSLAPGQRAGPLACHTFWMGSPPGAGYDLDERPRHRVAVRPFGLMRTPVTRAQYRVFDPGHNVKKYSPHMQCPAILVSWFDAFAFGKALGTEFRLPTEAEWEFACLAGTETVYWFGDDPAQLRVHAWHLFSWHHQELSPQFQFFSDASQPVGAARHVNPWGLCDMHGNVLEWCWDWFDNEWYRKRTGLSDAGRQANREEVFAADAGPRTGVSRVGRGGGWESLDRECRSADRYSHDPKTRFRALGFRLARSQSGG